MFEKLYKLAIIVIAVVIVGLSVYVIFKPSQAISQVSAVPTANYVVPESHVWEAITSDADGDNYLIFNKKTGEWKVVRYIHDGSNKWVDEN